MPGLDHLAGGNGAMLLWPAKDEFADSSVAALIRTSGEAEIPIFGRVLADEQSAGLLLAYDRGWVRKIAITSPSGERLGSIWRAEDGSVFIPFDPDEVCRMYWSERYLELLSGAHRGLLRWITMRCWYTVRRLLPRSAQIWLRRRYAPIQARSAFPRWPAETALHDLYDLFLGLLASVNSGPVPYLEPWPNGHRWALVLTHDVETAAGVPAIEPIVELERSLGVRSSWNFVPGRYSVDDALVERLTADGFEVGVHGLHHDGRDLASLEHLQARLPAIRGWADRWGAVGFRSPATHRRWEWMPLLKFEYDSSYPDTDPFEPQPGGCCSWLPFTNDGMIELPLTLVPDHTLFVILDRPDESVWIEKAELLRERGGMALIVTHPDYHEIDSRIGPAYARFLQRYAGDETAWQALPAEISAWWRRRAASRVEPHGAGWTVAGPAQSEARIAYAEPWHWK